MKLIVLALLISLPALAGGPGGGGGHHGPCAADAAKFCPGMKPGDGKLGPCMKSHASELSEGCKAMAAKRQGGKGGHGQNGGAGPAGGGE